VSDRTLKDPDNARGWESVGHEALSWSLPPEAEGTVDIFVLRRLESTTYSASIPATIAGSDPEAALYPALRREAADALTSIALFDAETGALPVAMPAVLLRSESASSSQIENLSATARTIAAAALGARVGGNAALIAANGQAMAQAIAVGKGVTRDSIIEIHRTLLERTDPDIVGRLRDRPVWIGKSSVSPHGADFVPPHYSRVPAAIEDLSAFAARSDVSVLVQAAVVHAQFETIHPFEDGNGRTGRALVHTVLRGSGYANHSTVPVSAGLLGTINRYFDALTAYRAGELAPIVEAFVGATHLAIANGRTLARDLVELREQWRSVVKARSDSSAWRLLDVIVEQPVVNSEYVRRTLGLSAQGAFNALEVLTGAGVLTQNSRDKRNQLWQAQGVLDAMDAFAERALRRSV